jgi:hypothetical protein
MRLLQTGDLRVDSSGDNSAHRFLTSDKGAIDLNTEPLSEAARVSERAPYPVWRGFQHYFLLDLARFHEQPPGCA